MPAILKGWVDRLFMQGFAYGLHDADGNPRKYGDGAFAGKRGLLLVTAGDRGTSFEGRGLNGHLDDLLFPINHGIFWYTGIAPLHPLTLPGVDSSVWTGIDAARDQVRRRMRGIAGEEPMPYRRMLQDYDNTAVCATSTPPGARICESISRDLAGRPADGRVQGHLRSPGVAADVCTSCCGAHCVCSAQTLARPL